MMSKIRKLISGTRVIFFCPGCQSTHQVNIKPEERVSTLWHFNGDIDKPTFKPSILVTSRWSQIDDTMTDEICHSFVTDGRIQFLGDSTHKLSGQIVDLPEWPYEPGSYGGIED